MERAKAYVGIDIGKRTCAACIMGADGGVLKRTKYPNTRRDANAFIDGLAAYDCMAACESTARMWIKTYEAFERRGISIILANPLWLKMAQSGVKTNRIDAQKLANKLRLDDIPACHVLGPEARRTVDILRQRVLLVRERTTPPEPAAQHTGQVRPHHKDQNLDVSRVASGIPEHTEAGTRRHGAYGTVCARRQAYQQGDIGGDPARERPIGNKEFLALPGRTMP